MLRRDRPDRGARQETADRLLSIASTVVSGARRPQRSAAAACRARMDRMRHRLPYVWDYGIDEAQFRDILAGRLTIGPLNRRWAAVRLIEYAPYREIIRMLGFRTLVAGWNEWRPFVRSQSTRRGLDFLVDYLPRHHPELL